MIGLHATALYPGPPLDRVQFGEKRDTVQRDREGPALMGQPAEWKGLQTENKWMDEHT